LKLLFIHSDYLEYEVKEEAIPSAEDVAEGDRRVKVDEVLVVFCSVEGRDEEDEGRVIEEAVSEVIDVAKRINVNNIVLYPYAHLSSELSRPEVAIRVLRGVEDGLKERGFNVKRAPFGWYKAFSLRCKGHPLSELSRVIRVEGVKGGKADEARVHGEYLIISPEGLEERLDLANLEAYDVLNRYPLLKQFIVSEEVGGKPKEAPPHITLMSKLGLVDYEPASDIGHFRFYPKGALIKDLLEAYANDIAVRRLGALKVETPLLYRLSRPDIAEQASRFLEKDYRLRVGGEELTLRFAGDFGLFSMLKDALISYRQLPLRVYELSKSFRLEQSGECVGLKRLRSFTMPDVHCFCADLEQGMQEYVELFKVYTEVVESMGIDYVLAFRVVKEFYEGNKRWLVNLVKTAGKPALIEVLPERKHYWIVKHEYQFVDSVGGNAQLCTVQLDVEDSERYGIYYVDVKGEKRGCIIVHSSMGSIERWIYALLEQAAKIMKAGKTPELPLWIAPIQVRVIPVSTENLESAVKIANTLQNAEIRVDVDDRDLTLPRKVRDAEVEWIPYIVVVGKEEESTGRLSVRVRRLRMVEVMDVNALIDTVRKQVAGKPFIPSYTPIMLSKRPTF